MPEVLGIGLDLVDLAQFKAHYANAELELLTRCFTAAELTSVGNGVDRIDRLAARFAVKEAVYKALGGVNNGALTDIETMTVETGAPRVALHGAAQRVASSMSVSKILISLTHSTTSAAAVAVALRS